MQKSMCVIHVLLSFFLILFPGISACGPQETKWEGHKETKKKIQYSNLLKINKE